MHWKSYLPLIVCIIISVTKPLTGGSADEYCPAGDKQSLCDGKPREDNRRYRGHDSEDIKRYLIYDQNFAEGFNLRRDVFIRMALLVRRLGAHWTLVLPNWSLVPHWRRDRHTGAVDDPRTHEWSAYFDVKSIQKFIPVVEYHEFVDQMRASDGVVAVDVVLSLEHFEDTFDEGKDWVERHSLSDCNETQYYRRIGDQIISTYDTNRHLRYERLLCLQIEGFVSTLKQIIENNFSDSPVVFVSNAEVILNDEFGSQEYWMCRRSMRFSGRLVEIANQFRKQYLNSDDTSDGTIVGSDWRAMRRTHGQAVGGQYLSVHLRRGDFAKYRTKNVPTFECMAKQVEWVLMTFMTGINVVFVASDATPHEWKAIEKLFNEKNIQLFRLTHSKYEGLSDGQLAIVEQLIAVHSRLFIGTYDSTFSFRIQEEREILGFRPNTTFNALCATCDANPLKLCKQESQWKIVY